MKKFIKQINDVFIMILLFFFYFFCIGIGFLLFKLLERKKKNRDSFWEDTIEVKTTIQDYQSAY